MLRVYKRVKINEDLLGNASLEVDFENSTNPLQPYLRGKQSVTLPAGKLVGITYNPYQLELEEVQEQQYYNKQAFLYSQTDIKIYDTNGRDITEETDISDYRHKGGGHLVGFKNVWMDLDCDKKITIEYNTIGRKPICGEFVFTIEQSNCEC